MDVEPYKHFVALEHRYTIFVCKELDGRCRTIAKIAVPEHLEKLVLRTHVYPRHAYSVAALQPTSSEVVESGVMMHEVGAHRQFVQLSGWRDMHICSAQLLILGMPATYIVPES